MTVFLRLKVNSCLSLRYTGKISLFNSSAKYRRLFICVQWMRSRLCWPTWSAPRTSAGRKPRRSSRRTPGTVWVYSFVFLAFSGHAWQRCGYGLIYSVSHLPRQSGSGTNSPCSLCCESGSGLDPDPEGQKWPTEIEKSWEILCFEVLDVLFWGLKASPVAWTSFKEA